MFNFLNKIYLNFNLDDSFLDSLNFKIDILEQI